jgi:predicted PurR-regulated permease PerM
MKVYTKSIGFHEILFNFVFMLHQIHPNKIRQVLLLAVLILLAILIGKEMYFLLGSFMGAITLYVIMRNWMIKLTTNYKWKKGLAALFLIFSALVVIILPLSWVTSIAFERIKPVIQNPQILTTSFETIHQYLIQEYNIDILNAENIAKINVQLIALARQTIGGTMSGAVSLLFMFFMLYFMLVSAFDIEMWLRKSVPFKNSNVQKVIGEFRSMVYSNAIGIPLVAILQGFVGLIGYWIFGVEDFILMGLLTAVASVMPVVGSMAIYIPLCVYELSLGHTWQGVGIGLWGFILIGSIDNIARFMLQKKIANIHPLITIFGVIIGVNLFGFLGIIFGPILLSMFILLVRIYIDEFGRYDSDEQEIILP